MRGLLARALACALAVHMLAACGGVRLYPSPPVVQGIVPDEALAASNARRVREAYGAEWALRGQSTPPRRCLALSGGGIRSAAFSIGALKALQGLDGMGTIDVMSGVSGGAYALGWYYTNHLNDGGDLSWLTGSDVGPVARLDDKGFIGLPEYVALFGANLLAAPWNFFTNGIFGWHLNTVPARPVYELRIRETFLGNQDVSFPRLRTLIGKRRLPTFVIATTAYVDDDRGHLGGRLANTVFEFTPIQYGSPAFRHSRRFPFGLARAVAISGGAVDSAVLAGSTQKTMLSLFNQDLTYTIANFPQNLAPEEARARGLDPAPWTPAAHNAAPFPLYFFSGRHQWDAHGIRIRLADGGHSENLGVFSLVRRLCEHIVIVDAEHDPEYTFNSYYKLKDALRAEVGVELAVPDIDALRTEVTDPNVPRPKAARDPVAPDTAAPETDPRTTVQVDRRTDRRDRAVQFANGTIRWIPVPGADGPRRMAVTVAYVKLALTQADVAGGHYPDTVTEYWTWSRRDLPPEADRDTNCHETDIFRRSCLFPQESTAFQDFDGRQFRAYRDLGATIVLRNRGRLFPPVR